MEFKEIATALAKAQSTMQNAKKDKTNPHYKSSYADIAAVFDAIRGPFAENGLCVTQTMHVEGNQTKLRTSLLHTSGQIITSEMLLPSVTDPQKMGSAITYYRRYSLMSIAGLAADDDDGNDAKKGVMQDEAKEKKQNQTLGNLIETEKAKELNNYIGSDIELREAIHKLCNVSSVYEIREKQLVACRNFVKNWKGKNENN
jgi:hypothetical protein